MLFLTLFSTVSTPISYLLSASSLAQSSQQRLPAKATALVLQENCRQPLQKEPSCYPSTRMEGRQEKNTLRSKVKALVSPSYTFSSMNWRTWARLWSRTDPLKFRGEDNPPTPSFFFSLINWISPAGLQKVDRLKKRVWVPQGCYCHWTLWYETIAWGTELLLGATEAQEPTPFYQLSYWSEQLKMEASSISTTSFTIKRLSVP